MECEVMQKYALSLEFNSKIFIIFYFVGMAEAQQTPAGGKDSDGTSKPEKAISYENYLQVRLAFTQCGL